MVYEANPKSYVTCSVLNNCFFDKGKVLLAKHRTSRSLVAVKHFRLEDFTQDQYDAIIDEIIFMRQLKHPNILPCLTSYVLNFDLFVILPLMGYTSCHDLIYTHFPDGLAEIVISAFLRDVLHALEYVHNKGYIHRAVKARHILIQTDGRACLSGLRYLYPISRLANGGSANAADKVHSFPLNASHNLNWLSPELLEQNSDGYDEKSDVYSVGVTACELANGVVPFAEQSTTLMLTEKVRGVVPQLLDCTTLYFNENGEGSADGEDTRLQFHHHRHKEEDSNTYYDFLSRKFTDAFHAFVTLCSHRSASDRPSPKQLLSHSFFKSVRRLNLNLPELLLPAVPFTETNTAELREDVAFLDDDERMSRHFDNMSVFAGDEWDF